MVKSLMNERITSELKGGNLMQIHVKENNALGM